MEQEDLSFGELIRLTARVLSVASISILLMILLNKGNYPRSASLEDLGLFLCFPVGICLGMIFSWKMEGLGGIITVVSLALFYSLHSHLWGTYPEGELYILFSSPGFLFILSALMNDPEFD
ncbi:MAG: hypothetical protein JW971_02990 [Synergistales bacterium]|nr:hypothetical protein [Synergistales bacterium]